MTDFLFSNPSFLIGAGRVLDLGASLERDAYNMSRTPGEADDRAIRNDWAAVGADMSNAIAKGKAEASN